MKYIKVGKNIKYRVQRHRILGERFSISHFSSVFSTLFLISHFSFLISPAHAAFPASSNYQIQEYSFGAGGTNGSTSSNYGLSGLAGGVEFGRPSSATYQMGSGLSFMLQANVPAAPTFSNPSDNYDRLQFIINTSNNPADTTYAIAISTDNFASDIRYIKSDNTIGATLTNADFQTYTDWGGATGEYVTGLLQDTIYTIKVKARQGDYTESEFGPTAQAQTSAPSLTFSVSANNVNFSNLNAGNSYTDSSKTTVLTTSTNAYNGYIVNARSTGPLTAGATTISDYTSPNSAPTTWSGNGFGYTTNDSNLTGGTANRFTSGGPKYAGFTTSSPGDPVADHAGPVTSAILNEQFTISYRVTVPSSQRAAQYNTSVLYIVVPSY